MLVLTAIQILINAKKKNRAQQFIRVIISMVFAIGEIGVVLIWENDIISLVNNFLVKLPVQIPFDLKNILNTVGEALIFNLVLYFAYVVLRMVLGVINRTLLAKKFLFQATAEIFYEYAAEYDQWFVKEKWINVRELFKIFSWAGGTAAGVILAITWYLQIDKGISVMIFPAMAHMIIVEFYGFINGYTKEEFEHIISGEDSYAQKISNFYKVREIYEKIFPREVLVSYTGCEYASTKGTMDLLEELRAGDRDEAIVSHFFTLNETEDVFDNDCILAATELMKGENVIFFNPFYKDLGKYIVLPVMSTLLKGRNCLIIVGRNSAKEDIKTWMSNLLWETSKIKSMWRVNDLSFKMPECEVGVLGLSQLYDEKVLEANKEFLKQVKFVIILEASLMINTGQVGLSILAGQMVNYSDKPAYCILDRMVDGLVDTMSHLLQSEITKVVAPPVSRNLHTGMAWDADGDYLRQKLFGKQTKFLGNGTELAAVAIKNQVQEVSWFAERKAPVRDIKWIAGQYFPSLCQYMNLPIQQQSIYEKINFIANIWSTPEKSEQFLIAEDEFINMYSTMRTFLSRGKDQTFVNILSENYLLRDYMRCNPKLFMSNPNAIPSMVPDYAKTERNTLIKLLLLMSYDSVTESRIKDEFKLLGIETDDVLHILNTLLAKYTNADSTIFTIKTITYDGDGTNLKDENIYSILSDKFEEFFGDDLKNAYYICEDEKSESEYIEAKLFGHVTQTILPGQMVTYNGKYYIAKYVTPKSGVILRRASNLYDGRKYYRQIRKYFFEKNLEKEIISSKIVMDVEVTRLRTDFRVETTGYLQMNSNNDLRSARLIDFTNDPSANSYIRKYHNKAILRIKLPETTDKLRFTVSLLLTEVMRSIFPEGWPYIAVLCTIPEDINGMLNNMLYGAAGEVEDEYIYIVEDSNLDLGLLEAIENNFILFMEIIADFICWHFEKMKESPVKDPEIHTMEFPETDYNKRKKFTELAKKVRKLFGGKKEEEVRIGEVEKVENQKPTTINSSVNSNTDMESGSMQEASVFTPENTNKKFSDEDFAENNDAPVDVVAIDGTDIFDTDTSADDNEYFEECFAELGIVPLTKSRYQEECFLKFGFSEIDQRIQLEETKKYLAVRGFSNNALTKARHRDGLEPNIIDLAAVNHCDFCGLPLSGVSYQRLSDGRIRCNDCGSTAITSVDELKKIFYQILEMMQNFYGIEYKSPIIVKTTDAKTIARGAGSVYTPTTDVAVRILGYAQRKGKIFNLMVENGSPRLATIETMVHEMTHIWQYLNWDTKAVKAQYPEPWKQDVVYEGMAIWASIQYLYLIGENSYAMQQELLQSNRDDVYGIGFKMYIEKFPIIKDSSLVRYSPFTVFPPL